MTILETKARMWEILHTQDVLNAEYQKHLKNLVEMERSEKIVKPEAECSTTGQTEK